MERLAENRIFPLESSARDSSSRAGTYRPFVVLANKCDEESFEDDFAVLAELIECDCPLVCASAKTGYNIEAFKKTVYDRLNVIRVYSKSPGQEPDLETPFVLKQGTTVEEFAAKVHQDFYKNLSFARVWGSADHDGQMVGRDFVLQDRDVVELRM
jgi:ribosome-interacting GTPase 1